MANEPTESLEERLAEEIGEAIARYGSAGGDIRNVRRSLLRYAAQTHLHCGDAPAERFLAFSREARSALTLELEHIKKQSAAAQA